jgi:hypothetical protein
MVCVIWKGEIESQSIRFNSLFLILALHVSLPPKKVSNSSMAFAMPPRTAGVDTSWIGPLGVPFPNLII